MPDETDQSAAVAGAAAGGDHTHGTFQGSYLETSIDKLI